MNDREWLAQKLEQNRPHLRSVAYRMLGSLGEAEDAVQEAWLRLNRSDAQAIGNLSGWLTTVIGRVCLDVCCALAILRDGRGLLKSICPTCGFLVARTALTPNRKP